MKRYISILSLLIVAFGIRTSVASECMDEDCELEEPIVIEEIVEESDILEPVNPEKNLWFEDDFSYDIESDTDICLYDSDCPFDTIEECEIWRKKPIYNESVAPRAPHLLPFKQELVLARFRIDKTIDADDEFVKPLLDRYLTLMRASHACCSEGIIYKMHKNKADDAKIYNFLQDDVNGSAVTTQCLILPNNAIMDEYSYGVTGDMVEQVRNSCICKNRQWFDSLLEPFFDLYQAEPGFQYAPFYYTYLDSFQRTTTVSINEDVQTVMQLLQYCPD